MAKTRKHDVAVLAPELAETAAVMEYPAAPQWYRVTLHCPTPLAHRTLDIEAVSEAEAWEIYQQANNIGPSDHDRTIQRLDQPCT